MKQIIHLISCISVVFLLSPGAWAECTTDKDGAKNKCDKKEYQKVKDEADKSWASYMKCRPSGVGTPAAGAAAASAIAPGCSAEESNGFLNAYAAAKAKGDEFSKACGDAIDQCSSSCAADEASPIPGKAAEATQNKNYCENGEPKENKQASDQNNAAMMQALAAMLAAMMQRGQQPPANAVQTVCADGTTVTSNSTASTTGTTGTSGATGTNGTTYANSTAAAICPTLDKASTSSDDLATGSARTAGLGDEFTGDGNLQGGNVAPGTPAQVQLSSALPGNTPSGGMGAGAAGGGVAGKDPGKKGDDGGGAKLGTASTSGGGGGSGSMAGGGGGRPIASGGPMTRTPVDGPDKVMQAALEKAAQQRGLASDGPAGGITGANSLDNFQKVEKRMQSERNNLNEL